MLAPLASSACAQEGAEHAHKRVLRRPASRISAVEQHSARCRRPTDPGNKGSDPPYQGSGLLAEYFQLTSHATVTRVP
jgi:hypothetical protein